MAQFLDTPIYKQFTPLRTAFYIMAAVLFLCFSASAMAETNPAYTVEGVEVDVTAENAVKAREKALDEAQAKAYQTLAERFLDAEALKSFTVPDPITLSTLVQDFEVTKEQLSKKRYKGTYVVRFRPNAMKNQMASQGQVYSDQIKKPVLVLPFYMAGDKTLLWGDENPFMRAWRLMPTDKSMMQPTVLPMGDVEDIAQLSGDDALNYDPIRVQELATRYNADDVAILMAGISPAQTMPPQLKVGIYSNGFEGPVLVQSVSVDMVDGESPDLLYARAAQKVKSILRQNWKANAAYNPSAPAQQTATQPSAYPPAVTLTRPALGQLTNYTMLARFASVQDWVRMKNTLDGIYGMQGVLIKTMKPREALLDIRYAGDISALHAAFRNAGMSLNGGQNGLPYEVTMGSPSSAYYYR